MQIQYNHNQINYSFNLAKAIDISIPLHYNVKAFNAPDFKSEPVKSGQFTGLVSQGSSVNFLNLSINPHGNGTHTECLGHITAETISINDCLKKFHFPCLLISVSPGQLASGDYVITPGNINLFKEQFKHYQPEACVVRTLPNNISKKSKNYSNTNPPYFLPDTIQWLNNQGIQHLLCDLPSIDREIDEGKLLAHKAFWQFPRNPQLHKTITEMVFVPNIIADGFYLLNLQIISLQTDASPSKPVLFSPV